MSTAAVAQMLSIMLYQKRFFPFYSWCILGGLDEEGKGAVYTYDPVGSYERESCRCAGSASSLIQPFLDNQVCGLFRPRKEALTNVSDQDRFLQRNYDTDRGFLSNPSQKTADWIQEPRITEKDFDEGPGDQNYKGLVYVGNRARHLHWRLSGDLCHHQQGRRGPEDGLEEGLSHRLGTRHRYFEPIK